MSEAAFLAIIVTLISGCAKPEEQTICSVSLTYSPIEGESPVRVDALGDFNGWTSGSTPLEAQPDGSFAATFTVSPGDHLYRLRVDDRLMLDPLAPLTQFDAEGREQSLLRVEDCRLPRLEVRGAHATADGELDVEAAFLPGVKGDALDQGSVVATAMSGADVATDVTTTDDGVAVVSVRASGLAAGKHTVHLSARDRAGRSAQELVLPLWVEEEPFDWDGALVYQVIIDRFAPSGEPLDAGLPREEAITRRHGGDLVGLTAALEDGYLDALGVDALWISPLYDNPDDLWPWYLGLESAAYHGYWPISAREVEPLLGGSEAAHDLVDAAHARGIRVILDVVPNHVHIEHPYYAEHANDGWFNGSGDCVCGSSCSWAEDIDHCWFSEYLPDLRWKNPVVARQVVDDTLFWLETYDLDGLRIDAIPMMPLLATRELVAAVSNRLERGPVGVHLLGETYTGAGDYETITRALGPFGLDGQFDFPLFWEIRRVLARGEGSMAGLDRVVHESERTWAEVGGGDAGRAVMSPFIGNHDVPRFISEAAGDEVYDPVDDPPEAPGHDEPYQRLLLAHALTLTLPGAPVIYYGDEIGMPGATDPDNRRPMRFNDELTAREETTLEAVARLGRLRACLPSLRRGDRQTLVADDDVYAFLRDASDGAPAVVVLNRSATRSDVVIELPEALQMTGDGQLVDALSGSTASLDGSNGLALAVEPLTAMVLIPADNSCARP